MKDSLFFALTFLVITVSCSSCKFTEMNSKLPPYVTYILCSLVGALLILFLYKTDSKCDQKDKFHFELTPAKRCEGFPYMQTSDPKLFKFCDELLSTQKGQDEYNAVNCGGAFVGRPVTWDYTPESNSKWENNRCL